MKIFLNVVLIFFIVLSLAGCGKTAQQSNTADLSDISDTYTALRSPFNGNGDWYLTQLFGAYYQDSSLGIDGHHTGEDWNYASGDGDANMDVYPIAPGTVVGWGPVVKGDTQGSKAGFYIVIKHTGTFIIPGSIGAHIQSLSEPQHESGRASNYGYSVAYSKDLFGSGTLIDYDLGEKTDNGTYSYSGETVSTIYSVYMHINDPSKFINGLGSDKQITEDMLDTPIGSLKGGMSEFPSHLHFEIRIGDSANITASSLPGNINGYFTASQDMVDAGYREPSVIIQANGGQGSISGEVLGATTSNFYGVGAATAMESAAPATDEPQATEAPEETQTDEYSEDAAPTETPTVSDETIDISGKSKVSGEFEDEDQIITYTYTPSISGIYEFDIESKSNIWMEMHDDVGSYVDGGYIGKHAVTFEAGGKYIIKLNAIEPCKYVLNISVPDETKDISGQTEINGELRYESQVITFTYTPSMSGDYEFDIEGGSNIWMVTHDDSDSYVDGGYNGIHSLTLEAGKQYTIKLSGLEPCNFRLTITFGNS